MSHYIVPFNPRDSRRQVLSDLILYIRKSRHSEVKSLTLNHTIRKWKARMQMLQVCLPDKALCCALTSSSWNHVLPTSGAWNPLGPSAAVFLSEGGEFFFYYHLRTSGHVWDIFDSSTREWGTAGICEKESGMLLHTFQCTGQPPPQWTIPAPGCQQY